MKRLYLLSILLLASGLCAHIFIPEGKNEFFEGLPRHPYAVVHYINYEQVGEDKVKEEALNAMKTAFSNSSNESAHVLAKISFIGVNSRLAPDLISDIEQRYQLKKSDMSKDFSVVFLFKNGKPVQDESGKLAMLENAFDQTDLGTFIQQYMGDYIAHQIQQAEARALYTVQQQPRTVTRYVEQPVYYRTEQPAYYRSEPSVYVGPYWGYGYPYYGWGPGFGIGFGFGGRRGGFGFGLGF